MVVTIELDQLNTPRALFTPVHDLDPTELAGGEATHTETLPDNGEKLSLHTQPPSQSSLLIDSPYAPESPPQLLFKYVSAAAQLEIESDLLIDHLTVVDDKLFGV